MPARATLVIFCLTAASAYAADPDCGVDEHVSGGHCCRAGEDWVPAKRRCVCLEPDVCGGGAAKKSAPAPKAKEAKEAKPDGWTQVGQAIVAALDFENMVNQMKAMDNDFSRMAYAKALGEQKRVFTCEQISRLMATAQFDTSACDIAGKLYPSAADRDNFATLLMGLRTPALSQAFLKQRCGRAP